MPILIKHEMDPTVAGNANYAIGAGKRGEYYDKIARHEKELADQRHFQLYRDALSRDFTKSRDDSSKKAQAELEKQRLKNRKDELEYQNDAALERQKDLYDRKMEMEKYKKSPEYIMSERKIQEQKELGKNLADGKVVLSPKAQKQIDMIKTSSELRDKAKGEAINKIINSSDSYIPNPKLSEVTLRKVVTPDGKTVGYINPKTGEIISAKNSDEAFKKIQEDKAQEKKDAEAKRVETERNRADDERRDYENKVTHSGEYQSLDEKIDEAEKVIATRKKLIQKNIDLGANAYNERKNLISIRDSLKNGDMEYTDALKKKYGFTTKESFINYLEKQIKIKTDLVNFHRTYEVNAHRSWVEDAEEKIKRNRRIRTLALKRVKVNGKWIKKAIYRDGKWFEWDGDYSYHEIK